MKVKIIAANLMFVGMFATSAYAQQFYKWVDAQGVTHYGEELPVGVADHKEFEFPDDYAASNPEEDYYSIQNQLKRLQENRSQQRRDRQVSTKPVNQTPAPVTYVYHDEPRKYYVPAYYGHHYLKYRDKGKVCCKQPKVIKPPARISYNTKASRHSAGFSAWR